MSREKSSGEFTPPIFGHKEIQVGTKPTKPISMNGLGCLAKAMPGKSEKPPIKTVRRVPAK